MAGKFEYSYNQEIHNLKTPRKVVPLLMKMFRPQSVVDVGCGNGTWLKAFEDDGVNDYLGIDHSNLDEQTLLIPQSKFMKMDLKRQLQINRTFNICLCLEVAEHLPIEAAETLVESLTKLSQVIVFSAAIPGQGGQMHLNEQWLSYWKELFGKYHFFVQDSIRSILWHDQSVEPWYKQNLVIFSSLHTDDFKILDIVHPEVFKSRMANQNEMIQSLLSGKQGVFTSAKILARAIKYKFQQWM